MIVRLLAFFLSTLLICAADSPKRIVVLGDNDGLRGLPVSETRANLQSIIDRAREKHPKIKILLAGMKMPANMGADYTAEFEKVFPEIAQKNKTALIPFVLENVGGKAELN